MEYALLINDLSLFDGSSVLESFRRGLCVEGATLAEHLEVLSSLVPEDASYSYLYYGSEFCEHRLPSKVEMRAFLSLCDQTGASPVLITPPVTDFGVDRVRELVDYSGGYSDVMSVVVNDLGMAYMLSKLYPGLSIIAGRVLDKTSHDPRVSSTGVVEYYGGSALRIARTPALSADNYRKALHSIGFERFEFDYPHIGLEVGAYGYPVSLYWPYGYLTTGRVCRSRGVSHSSAFPSRDCPCPRYCNGGIVKLDRPRDDTRNVEAMTLYQCGNTIFYLNRCNLVMSGGLDCWDRLVLQLL